MPDEAAFSLERALARTENDADETLKAAEVFVRSARKTRLAAHIGDLKELQTSLEAAERSLSVLAEQFANTKERWQAPDNAYFDSYFAKELVEEGRRQGMQMVERDERLFAYPSLLRVSPIDRTILVDKKKERRVRPSVLVGLLKARQKQPVRFRSEQFLEALHSAYLKVVAAQPRLLLQDGPVIALADIYELFTLLPGQSKEYSVQEFARDVYLLHRSGSEYARNGSKVAFSISRGVAGKTLTAFDERGDERRYHGISFTPAARP